MMGHYLFARFFAGGSRGFFPFWGSLEDTCSRRVLSEIKSVSQPFSGSWQLLVGFASASPWAPSCRRLLRSWLSWSAGRACSRPCGSGWIWPASTSFCWQNVRPGTAKLCPRLAVESYDLADGSRQLTRDPGDVLWADDCLELTLGAAAPSWLLPGAPRHAALRTSAPDLPAGAARSAGTGATPGTPAGPPCLPWVDVQQRCSGRMAWKSWRYATWTGAASALFGHSCD